MIDPRARPGWSTARRAGPSASLLSVLLASTGCDTAPLPDTADAPDSPAPEDSGEVPEGCGLARLEPVATEGGTLTAASARAYTGEPGDALGTQVHGIGDIDRDGCGDLIIQATPGVSGAAPEPVHYLVAGPPPESGVMSAVADAIWTDEEWHHHSEFGGNRTVPDVDLDGDHQMDVAFAPSICAGYCEVARAEVFLLSSGAAWPGTVQELPVLIRDDPSCENSSLLAGDWNGDGASDLAMFGGWNYGVSAWGAAWWGPFTAERQCQAPDARVPLPAGEDADLFFLTTPRAGDLDGDGRDELVIVGQRDREVDSLRRLFVIESVPSGDFDLDAPLLRLDDTFTGSTLLALRACAGRLGRGGARRLRPPLRPGGLFFHLVLRRRSRRGRFRHHRAPRGRVPRGVRRRPGERPPLAVGDLNRSAANRGDARSPGGGLRRFAPPPLASPPT